MSDLRARRALKFAANPFFLGALLALLAINMSTARPVAGTDSSFRVGLTEATVRGMEFGIDVVWPYGPLGYLGGPTIISRGLLAAAVLYQFLALTLLFAALVLHLARLGLRRRWIVVVLAPFALAIGTTQNMVAEVVSLAVVVVLVVLWQDDRPTTPALSAWWVLTIAGFVAGAQLLVKVGPGAIACAVVVVFAASTGRRVRQTLIAVAAIAAGFLIPWFATGQAASALDPFLRTSLELSAGYQDAQAFSPVGQRMVLVGLLALAVAAVGAFGAFRWVRKERRALWAVIPVGLAAWFALKQGLVRWDDYHALTAVLLIGLLVVALPWDRRLLALPLGVLIVGALVAFVVTPLRVRSTLTERVDVALVLLSSSQHADEVVSAREGLRASYDVPTPVVEALADGDVHAEPVEINAVWGYDLAWNPLPVLQSYAAYTIELDNINADRYAPGVGPDGVLFNPSAFDNRYELWESPAARVALTCNFSRVASAGAWTALRRAPDACGAARELRTERVASGEAVEVPEPTRPDALVVARFELPGDPVGRLVSAIARPLRYAQVTIDGTSYRLMTGTAENAHLVRSPGRIGERELPDGRVELSTISFSNVGSGDVVVRFEEIPLEAS